MMFLSVFIVGVSDQYRWKGKSFHERLARINFISSLCHLSHSLSQALLKNIFRPTYSTSGIQGSLETY